VTMVEGSRGREEENREKVEEKRGADGGNVS
jgi:hypothetical protein